MRASARCVRETDGRATPPRCDAAARRSLVGERPEHVHPRRPPGGQHRGQGAGHQADDDQQREAAATSTARPPTSTPAIRSARYAKVTARPIGRTRHARGSSGALAAGALQAPAEALLADSSLLLLRERRQGLETSSHRTAAGRSLLPAAEDPRACSDGQAGISVHAGDTLARDEREELGERVSARPLTRAVAGVDAGRGGALGHRPRRSPCRDGRGFPVRPAEGEASLA